MMSAIVCGKRSFFEEIQTTSSPVSGSPPVSKKLRCSSATSPVRFSYSPPRSLINQLKVLFPDMDSQLLEKVLEESGNNLDAAIKSLQGLRATPTVGDAVLLEDSQVQNNLPVDGAEWVELVVKEMMSATSLDDARFRATRVLESLEKSISARAGAEASQNFLKVNNYALTMHLRLAQQSNSMPGHFHPDIF
ncbi:uncharacterized protein LOC111391791 isoform X2 [Olea europaea subsp. europaea]|uniref:Uncharacterized protein LOC111391791 isoform X2 n=1 Tax=Olea europaea subsp. europaea TaxID=158383 RepID=A0A8S0VKY2_OLEEU|nr:uncharacterized protein LOC111391791 isoform X2 [Olea europaea subsp. europaea]